MEADVESVDMALRILVVHNFYGSEAPSGENRVVESEIGLLRNRGNDVELFSTDSAGIRQSGLLGKIRGGLSTPWNPFAARRLRGAVRRFRPDVMHVHNTFPLISPAIFAATRGLVPRVLTLHNYRLVCAAAIPLREGRTCTECLDKRSSVPAIRHGCYRGSRVATLPLAASVALHRSLGTWEREVEAFIALSEFQRDQMVATGLPGRKMFVKPNFFAGDAAAIDWGTKKPMVAYVGRLSTEKGVDVLVRAWKLWGDAAPELRIIGDGPLRSVLEHEAAGMPIRFLGQLPGQLAQAEIAESRLLIVPSVCFDAFPLVTLEAFALSTPVAVSDLGPLPGIINHGGCGVLFPPADPAALKSVVSSLWIDSVRLEALSSASRREFELRYTPESNYQQLMTIYDRALAASS